MKNVVAVLREAGAAAAAAALCVDESTTPIVYKKVQKVTGWSR